MGIVLTPHTNKEDNQFISHIMAAICKRYTIYSIIPKELSIEDFSLVYLPGGADVDPKRYGGNAALCGLPNPYIEAWDKEYIPKALKAEIPIVAICRGSQTLWVTLGGRLKEEVFPEHGRSFLTRTYGTYRGVLQRAKGAWGNTLVNSLHHQAAYGDAPDGVEIGLYAGDGVVEGYSYGNFAVAMQWHPELMPPRMYLKLAQKAVLKKADSITKEVNVGVSEMLESNYIRPWQVKDLEE